MRVRVEREDAPGERRLTRVVRPRRVVYLWQGPGVSGSGVDNLVVASSN